MEALIDLSGVLGLLNTDLHGKPMPEQSKLFRVHGSKDNCIPQQGGLPEASDPSRQELNDALGGFKKDPTYASLVRYLKSAALLGSGGDLGTALKAVVTDSPHIRPQNIEEWQEVLGLFSIGYMNAAESQKRLEFSASRQIPAGGNFLKQAEVYLDMHDRIQAILDGLTISSPTPAVNS